MDAATGITVLIDNSLAQDGTGTQLFTTPDTILTATCLSEVPDIISAAERAAHNGKWVAGFIAYEAAGAFDAALTTHAPDDRLPLVWFAVFDSPQDLSPTAADHLWADEPQSAAHDLTLPFDQQNYTRTIDKIHAYLDAGDAYQINFTMQASFRWDGSAKGLYRTLRQGQRTAHSAMIETDNWSILSVSPELFLTNDGTTLRTRPMKGTAPRGLTLMADNDAATALRDDPKSRAENLMIVDLLRNDLARVTQAGSVSVDHLFQVEHYPTLNTMTSTISGTLQADQGLADIMGALFPCGSVTGAPKKRAMEIIHELEAGPRGPYTGAIGVLNPDGTFSFNVAIRTPIVFPGGEGRIGLGSGIVADSNAQSEYEECHLKGRFLTDPRPAFDLFETTVWRPDSGFLLLEAHLQRLATSATYFGYRFDRDEISASLARAAQSLPHQPHRIRFAINRYGAIDLRIVPLDDGAFPTQGVVAIAEDRTRSDDLFLHHKTSLRPVYDRLMGQAAKEGLIDYLVMNERGEITEGSKTNLFIIRDGVWLTPPQSSGLLPGTMRAEVMADKQVREQVLTRDDLKCADALYVSNSVIGLVPVSLRD
ncbi:MAG: aminodeoxychorismate synthase component I [Alphaproteobacteria bacterium]